ncbi:hypothetical protein ACHAXT_000806 [Thalassiosira profunda]
MLEAPFRATGNTAISATRHCVLLGCSNRYTHKQIGMVLSGPIGSVTNGPSVLYEDPIDAIAIKAAVGDDEESVASSITQPLSPASKKLVTGLTNAISEISSVLQTSAEVREKFISARDTALVLYQIEIGVIDEELERLRKRGKKKVASTEAEVEITLLSDELSQLGGIPEKETDAASETTARSVKSGSAAKKSEEQARMESVSNLLTKMEAFQKEEESLARQLANKNGLTDLSQDERQKLEEKLAAVRARQTQEVVASAKEYKPRFSSKVKSSDLGLNLPAISDILQGAVAEVVPIGPVSRKDRKQSRPKPSKGKALVKDHTNTSATTQAALSDRDNFLCLHELDIEKPKTSDRKQSVSRSLSSIIQPLNATEMGRRNRVGR